MWQEKLRKRLQVREVAWRLTWEEKGMITSRLMVGGVETVKYREEGAA